MVKGVKTPVVKRTKREVKTPKSSAKKKKKPENPLSVYDFSDGDEDFDDEGSSPTLCLWSAKRANRKGDYDVFVTQTRSKLMEENPDADGSEIDHMLKTRWSHMSDDLKAKYYVRELNGDDSKTTPVSKKLTSDTKTPKNGKSPRGRKPNSVNSKRKSTPNKSKDSASPKKRPSSMPLKSASTSEKPKRVRKSAPIEQMDSVESEETPSEDAMSESEIENRELNDRVCEICNEEALEDYSQCSGLCFRYYHKNCLPKTFNSETSQCQECSSGAHLCFICHSHSSDVKKCSDSKCGRFYHMECLQNNYPHNKVKDENNDEGFICPLHSCLTCHVEHQDDQVHSYLKKRLLKCLKCPTAYHLTDDCLSAGSVKISFSYIICPEHIPNRKHVNVNWCFSCNSGGSLICCERCPSAFHQTCLKTPLPEGNFYCEDCVIRKQLHYNDIVWVKLGPHRWWPSKVCHPKNCPDNVMALSHSIGDFPVYFYGSHNYYWVNQGKAFPFVEGDLTKAQALASAKGAKQEFRDAITEAIEAFSKWQEARKNVINRKLKPPHLYLRTNKLNGEPSKSSPTEDNGSEPIVSQSKTDGDHPCEVDKDYTNGSESTIIKSTPIKSKIKNVVRESASPRKRPSTTPVNKSAATSEKPKRARKSTSKEIGQSSEIEKTPKSQERSTRKSRDKSKDVDMENEIEQYKNKENDKEKTSSGKRKSTVVQRIDSVESEETRTSEDASSLSETDAIENRELNDRVCEKCNEEALEDYSQCSGLCHKYYHKNCLPKTFNSETSQCQECSSGAHLCFICHSHSSDVKKCSDSKCGKFYHIACLQNNYPYKMIKDSNNDEGFICPLHSCLTCYVEHQDDQVHSYLKKRLLKCLKCPTAYHLTDDCLSAGSITISFSYIICPEHIPNRKHVNVNWCFSCNSGGSLICCERCPSAFHQACLETPLPEGNFFCGDCLVRKQLHYNDIVWVKLGPHRWWPSKVCHPKNCPDNVMALSHSIGEFPVYFFGSHDYYWINQGKAFPFVEGDLTKAQALAKGAKREFRDAITEAIDAFSTWQEARKTAINRKLKPPPYVYLRVNKRVGKPPKSSPREDDDTEPIVCQCKSDGDYPCGVDEDCFNRLTLIECDPSRCNAGDKCQNRRFRKREYSKVQPFKTESRGWGLRALQDIKKGTFVIEYVGELIDEVECENRIKSMIEKHEPNFYFLTIDRDTIIDAGPKGNLARFMNHSCSPNCETQKWVVGGVTRVGLFAIQDIPQGAELTFNYNLHCRGNEKTACNCGAKNCSGFLGVRPNKIPDEESSKKQSKLDKTKPKPKPKNLPKKEFESFHEDECFKCGEGGELVMCDKRKCPKSYHLPCLKLTKLPRGIWLCPYHHCDECGKPSTKFCDMCPTSFCNEHGMDLFHKNDKNQQLCYEHLSADETSLNDLTKTAESSKQVNEIKENGDLKLEEAVYSFTETKHENEVTKDDEEKKDQLADNTENMEVDSLDNQENQLMETEETNDKIEVIPEVLQDEKMEMTEEPKVIEPELLQKPESESVKQTETVTSTENITEVKELQNAAKNSNTEKDSNDQIEIAQPEDSSNEKAQKEKTNGIVDEQTDLQEELGDKNELVQDLDAVETTTEENEVTTEISKETQMTEVEKIKDEIELTAQSEESILTTVIEEEKPKEEVTMIEIYQNGNDLEPPKEDQQPETQKEPQIQDPQLAC